MTDEHQQLSSAWWFSLKSIKVGSSYCTVNKYHHNLDVPTSTAPAFGFEGRWFNLSKSFYISFLKTACNKYTVI